MHKIWKFGTEQRLKTVGKNKIPHCLMIKLRKQGYSKRMIKELYKWYDSSEKKGVANF